MEKKKAGKGVSAIVTFIIPTIGRESLHVAKHSLRVQTNPNWKAIVIGDGLIPAEDEDPRFISLGIPNRRDASAMRNFAARLVDTEWVAFLDDDDSVDSNYVQWIEYYRNEEDDLGDTPQVMMFKMMNYGNAIPIENEIEFGRIGMSFAMFSGILKDRPFDGQGTGEDYRMIKRLHDEGYAIRFLPHIAYYVRPHLYV